jgi:hypothetical protein
MESLSVSEQHPGKCDWCSVEVDDLLLAAEEYVQRPDAKLDMEVVDIKDATVKQAAKAESWGF